MRTLFARGGGAVLLHHRIRASSGMVTAEFALGILAVVPLLLGVVMLTAVASVKVQVAEGARTAARMLARGDGQVQVREQIEMTLPTARLEVRQDGSMVRAVVSQPVAIGGIVPEFTITATAVTAAEESAQ